MSRRIRCKRYVLLAIAASAAGLPAVGDSNYVGPAGNVNWSDPSLWSPAGVPGAGTNVNFLSNDAAARTLIYDYTGAALTLGTLRIDQKGTGSNTFSMAGNNLSAAYEYVGETGSGSFNQMGGVNTVTNNVYLGNNQSTSGTNQAGTYLMGSGAQLLVKGSEYIGVEGVGLFTQNGGTNTVTGGLQIGYSGGSSGTYSLSDGAVLSVKGSESIGNSGTGTFNQTGGTHTAGTLFIGYGTINSGVFNLSGGTASFTSISLGYFNQGVGILNITGGSITVANSINVDTASGDQLYLNGGTLTAGSLSLPDATRLNFASGTLNITGGSSTSINGTFTLSASAGNTATFNNIGGSLNFGGNEIIGSTGRGIFNQTSGSSTVNGNLQLASTQTGVGVATVASGSFTVPNVYIGGSDVAAGGKGTFTLAGGTMNVSGAVKIWNTPGSSITLSGGTLTTPSIVLPDWNRFTFNSGALILNPGTINNPGDLSIASLAGGSATVTVSSNNLTVGGNEYVGHSGSATLTYNSGTHTVGAALYLGYNSGATGSYTMTSGSSSFLTVAGTEYIGYSGTGTFNQSVGANSANSLQLGVNSSGIGALTLSSGILAAGSAFLGGSDTTAGGKGTIKMTAGTISITGPIKLWNADSTLTQSAGTLSAASISAPDWGQFTFTSGILNLNGGTSSNPGNLTIGGGTASLTATLNLSAGTLGVGGVETIGLVGNSSSNGLVNQTGGTHTAAQFYLGYSAPSGGIYSMSNNASLTVTGSEYIGFNGNGVFNQTAGTHTVGTLQIGVNQSGVGSVNISGGTFAAANAYLGGSDTAAGGRGVLNLTGGVASVTGGIKVWNTSGSGIILSGGTLTAASFDLPDWNRLNFISGTLSLSGDSSNIGTLVLGGIGSNGTSNLNVSAGALSAQAIQVAPSNGSVVNQTGGTVTIAQLLSLIPLSGRPGIYNLSGSGTLTANDLSVSGAGNALYNQTGGSATLLNTMAIGGSSGSGTANLSGGALSVPVENIGSQAIGVFNHSSGTNTVATLNIGLSNAQGTYNLSGDANLVVTSELIVNSSFTASINQTGGKLSVPIFTVGTAGSGAVVQSDGVATTNTLYLGRNPGSGGTYTLINAASLNVTGDEFVGSLANGTFIQTGGTHVVAGLLAVSSPSGRSASYTLSGTGVLNTASVIIGSAGGNASFIQNGGTHTASTLLTISSGITGYTLAGGLLNADIHSSGPFVQSGGTYNGTFTNGGSVTMSGGTFAGTLVNNGSFTYSGGAFTGKLIHNGSMSISAPFLIDEGLLNNTSINVTNLGTLTINGQGLNNLGTLTVPAGTLIVNGTGLNNQNSLTSTLGTITGSGPLINNALMSASGTISGTGGFINNVLFTVPAALTLSNTGPNANYGTFNLPSGFPLRLNDPSVTLTNSGSIVLLNSTITGTGSLINATGGIIQGRGTIASNFSNIGGTLLLDSVQTSVALPFANSSVIQLNGLSANLSGGIITNSGVIQGNGTVSNDIVNTGTITPQSGTLTLSGNVTNSAAGTIAIPTGTRLLASAGLSANPGSISVLGGTFDNNSHSLSNTGQIAGSDATFRAATWSNAGQLAFTGGANNLFGVLNNQATGKVVVTGGAAATFYNPVSGVAGSQITISANSSAIFLGPVTGPITFTGAGTKYFEAGQSFAGAIAAEGVTTIEAAASVTSDQIVEKTLNITGQLTLRPNSPVSKVNSLFIDDGGKLDLGNNALIIDYTGTSPIASIRSAIIHGAITSSALNSHTAIGYAEASQAISATGGSFQGVPTDNTSVLLRYTLAGDSNLDGAVGFTDLVAVAQHYGLNDGSATWSMGDFNYDGNVGFADLVAVAQNYGGTLNSPPIAGASAQFEADLNSLTQVPEPSLPALTLILACSSHLTCRRRRRG